MLHPFLQKGLSTKKCPHCAGIFIDSQSI
ncbi:zf-TFIIB domain-containing protein [Vibrio harveyi]